MNKVALKRLTRDYSFLREIGPSNGIQVSLFNEDDLFNWKVTMEIPTSIPLGQDLAKLQLSGIEMHVAFPETFPFDHPFVKVIQPRMKVSGNVLLGGLFCTSLFSEKEWTCSVSSEMFLVQIRSVLISNPANSIDFECTDQLYSKDETEAALFRSSFKPAQTSLPTRAKFTKNLLATENPQLSGNKVLMPPSVLKAISVQGDLPNPMIFEIKSLSAPIKGYCGVLEFSANERYISVPSAVFTQLALQEGSAVQCRLVSPPKGTHLKFQAHKTSFLEANDMDNQKVISLLEDALSNNYSVLTVGDTIQVKQGIQTHLLNVLTCAPTEVISVVASPYLDVKIEFVAPLDWKEKETTAENPEASEKGYKLSDHNPNQNETPIDSAPCENCGRQVPKTSMDMHVMMCLRRNEKCDRCGVVYEKTSKEKHEEEMHAVVACQCNAQVEKYQLAQHKETDCIFRKASCRYCGMQTEKVYLDEHEVKCATRTVLCEKCNTYVKMGSLDHHQLTKCSGVLMDEVEEVFDCPICAFPQLSEGDLITHIQTAHRQEAQSSLVCPICLIRKGSAALENVPKSLLEHLEWHEVALIQKMRHHKSNLPGTGLPKMHYFH